MRLANGETRVWVARCAVRVSFLGGRQAGLETLREGKRRLVSDRMQVDDARRWCSQHDVTFDQEGTESHQDLNVSGSKVSWRNRPGLWAHYEAAQRGEFNVLVAYKLSRLGRNLRDTLDLCDTFHAIGVRIVSTSEGIDSENTTYTLLRNLLLSIAEFQAEEIGSNIHHAAIRRAKDGRIHGGGLPCWVAWDSAKRPVLVECQVNAIRRMVELRTTHAMGEAKIARRLNEEGFRTVKSARWTPSTVNKYLRDDWIDTMCGTGYLGRTKDEDDRIEIKGAFPPILSEEEANALRAVQQVIRSKYSGIGNLNWALNRKGKPRLNLSSPFLLGGLFKCAYCGRAMVGAQRAMGRRNYTCPQFKASPDLHKNGLGSVDRDHAEDAVLRVVRHALKSPPPPEVDKRTKSCRSEISKLEKKFARLEDAFLDGDFSRDRYREKKEEMELQLAALHKQEAINNMPEALRQVQAIGDDPTQEQLNQLVHLLVERIEGPIDFESVTIRKGATGLRKFLRVVLRHPITDGTVSFLAPIYKSTWVGERLIHAESKKTVPISR